MLPVAPEGLPEAATETAGDDLPAGGEAGVVPVIIIPVERRLQLQQRRPRVYPVVIGETNVVAEVLFYKHQWCLYSITPLDFEEVERRRNSVRLLRWVPRAWSVRARKDAFALMYYKPETYTILRSCSIRREERRRRRRFDLQL